MTTDFHAHWIPPALAARLRDRRYAPRIESGEGGERLVYQRGRLLTPNLLDLDTRCEFMERHGIARQVLSLAGLFGVDSLPLAESVPLVTAFNDAAADACRAHPEQFAALAALPLASIEQACRELERVHAMGLRGAILPADGFISLAAAEAFRPLFGAGARLGSHFFIHPGPLEPPPERHSPRVPADNAWQRRIVLETQATLSAATVTLALSDYLDPYPGVNVQVANLGGTIPFLLERMDEVCRMEADSEPLPSKRMGRCYFDTASFGPRAIEMAVACFGAERILLGTDCPIFHAGRALASVAHAHLDARARDLILFGNARRILER